jgi:hypothetical protein
MRMNFGEVLRIEDLGKHSAATVIHLGILLAGPVNVAPDPKRKHFYEIQGGQTVYYIHVSPVTGTIFLLATWKSLAGPGEALIRWGRYRRPDCEARPEPRTVATGNVPSRARYFFGRNTKFRDSAPRRYAGSKGM